jgi:glycosyltransferase involved in cell wall biosynthesis
VQGYGAGLVVPPEEPDRLAAAIAELRDTPALRTASREGALRLAQAYDRRRFAAQMLQILEEVAQTGRR